MTARFTAILLGIVALAAIASAVLIVLSGSGEREEPDLPMLMSQAQRYAEKLYLAGEAGNWPLAAFYVHELEEVAEDLRRSGSRKNDLDLGELAAELLLPAIHEVDRAIDVGPDAFAPSYGRLVAACNQCHEATGYGFVRIQAPIQARPYPGQRFAP